MGLRNEGCIGVEGRDFECMWLGVLIRYCYMVFLFCGCILLGLFNELIIFLRKEL